MKATSILFKSIDKLLRRKMPTALRKKYNKLCWFGRIKLLKRAAGVQNV